MRSCCAAAEGAWRGLGHLALVGVSLEGCATGGAQGHTAEAVAGYVDIVVDALVLAEPRSLADRYGRAAWLFGIRRSTCSRHNEPRSAESGPGATTIANRWGCKMRCLECGAEPAQACGRCGASAPVEYQLFVAEDRAADAA